MQPVAVEFSEVTRSYGTQLAAHGVSFSVNLGESFALIGINGAGKTTLLRCLLDYSRADAGTINVCGSPSSDARARAHLAWLPERFSPPYYLTGGDYLRYHGALRGVVLDEAAAATQLQALDFDPRALSRPARTYSKGMAQKLGLAACLLAGRVLTVLDEPMSGLDPRARALVREALAGLRREGRTLLFSSHALDDVGMLCDRLAVIHRGRVAFLGTPDALVARYAESALEPAFLRCIEQAGA
ncbi:MAG: ABC transporter ATP-binding protein [Proteobacteria bacterium]|nr:ABC transporter ATP-binding protein [Burkholderiales bacterium]